jgi:ABC-type glycerol-3-phosphate transport system substrate-binding protein
MALFPGGDPVAGTAVPDAVQAPAHRRRGQTRRRHVHTVAALVASSLAGVLRLGLAHAPAGPVEVAQDLGDGTAQNWLVYPDGRRVPIGCRYSMATGECVGPGEIESVPAPNAGRQSYTPGKFSFLTWWANNLNNKPFLDEAVRRYTLMRPGVTVEVVGENVAQLRDKFTVAQAAGDPFDASFVDFDWARDMYDAGLLQRLDPLIRQSPEVDDDKFIQRTLDPFRKTRGETYAIPVSTPNSLALLINSGQFEAAGLDPQGKDIKTWDDLARIAAQLTRRDGDDVTRSGYMMAPSFSHINYLGTYVNTTGAALFNEEQTRAYFTSDAALAAMQFLTRLHNGLRVSVPVDKPNRPSTSAAFLAGDAVIEDGNDAALTTAFRAPPPGLRLWYIPYPPGPGGRMPGSHTWINLMALSSKARNPDQAWEFLRWFRGDVDLHALRLDIMNSPSSLRAFYQQPAWQAAVKERPVLDVIPAIAELPGQAPFRRSADMQGQINPILLEAFLGRRDIKNALTQAQAIADRILG